MMDVKNISSGGSDNITSMLVRNAIAKNHELKDVMEKPIRAKEPKQVNKAEELTNQSTNANINEDNQQLEPKTGNLVDVNV
jgi:hypothetical protein